jgi:hypothetical protein
MLGRGHICESINREGITSPIDQAVWIDELRGMGKRAESARTAGVSDSLNMTGVPGEGASGH